MFSSELLGLLPPGRQRACRAGRPVVDHPFLDGTRLDPASKAVRYAELLRALPPGLIEWAVHPAAVDAETEAAHPHGWRGRRGDLEFLVSPRARELVAEEGVVLIDYRPLQEAWNARRVIPGDTGYALNSARAITVCEIWWAPR